MEGVARHEGVRDGKREGVEDAKGCIQRERKE